MRRPRFTDTPGESKKLLIRGVALAVGHKFKCITAQQPLHAHR